MVRKTKEERQQEKQAAEDALNTTRSGILVRPGQMWRSKDPRTPGRLLCVSAVAAGTATVIDGNRTTQLSVARMYPNSRGYEIFGSP